MKFVHLLLTALAISGTTGAQTNKIDGNLKNKEVKMSAIQKNKEVVGKVYQQVFFIDKFSVPEDARQEFVERMNINRNLVKTLPGFIEDAAYESIDESGNHIFITVATWKNEEALKNAKETVQAEYKKEGFNPAEMLERLGITMERGVYKEATLETLSLTR